MDSLKAKFAEASSDSAVMEKLEALKSRFADIKEQLNIPSFEEIKDKWAGFSSKLGTTFSERFKEAQNAMNKDNPESDKAGVEHSVIDKVKDKVNDFKTAFTNDTPEEKKSKRGFESFFDNVKEAMGYEPYVENDM